jgi:hypothetical protein
MSMNQFFHIKENIISEDICFNLINLYKEDRNISSLVTRKVDGLDKIIKELPLEDSRVKNKWKPHLEGIKFLVDIEVSNYLENFKTINLGNYKYSHSVFWEQNELNYIPFHYDAEFIYNEEGKDNLRNFLCLLYLNNAYEGGELIFPLQAKVFKPKTGSLVIFPTSYMFPYMTTPFLGKDCFLIRLNYFLDVNLKLKSEGYI